MPSARPAAREHLLAQAQARVARARLHAARASPPLLSPPPPAAHGGCAAELPSCRAADCERADGHVCALELPGGLEPLSALGLLRQVGAGPDGATVDSEGGLWEAQGRSACMHCRHARTRTHYTHTRLARVCARAKVKARCCAWCRLGNVGSRIEARFRLMAGGA